MVEPTASIVQQETTSEVVSAQSTPSLPKSESAAPISRHSIYSNGSLANDSNPLVNPEPPSDSLEQSQLQLQEAATGQISFVARYRSGRK